MAAAPALLTAALTLLVAGPASAQDSGGGLGMGAMLGMALGLIGGIVGAAGVWLALVYKRRIEFLENDIARLRDAGARARTKPVLPPAVGPTLGERYAGFQDARARQAVAFLPPVAPPPSPRPEPVVSDGALAAEAVTAFNALVAAPTPDAVARFEIAQGADVDGALWRLAMADGSELVLPGPDVVRNWGRQYRGLAGAGRRKDALGDWYDVEDGDALRVERVARRGADGSIERGSLLGG